ncbi:MAG: D-alanyl-D-alanine carboxypeptidase [Hydrogenibacillus schlegelii]|uniref:D-alanyl-D-alanine carboxypeptidase n=1 Tax=Hydrogenibacillus schlegelii TaxID=1484 RepID=A0A2T5GEM5_HYDSH|nr:MAG: D-alanyl-D-alanine carboxypeptidase [Hydrogenibacillus schlegelii]
MPKHRDRTLRRLLAVGGFAVLGWGGVFAVGPSAPDGLPAGAPPLPAAWAAGTKPGEKAAAGETGHAEPRLDPVPARGFSAAGGRGASGGLTGKKPAPGGVDGGPGETAAERPADGDDGEPGASAGRRPAEAPSAGASAPVARPPTVSAASAALIDVESGRLLYEKNAHERRKIASLTKIMTAILAIELGRLDDVVTISPRAVGVEGSSIYLRQGERMTLRDLLYGLMLRSGNDAAVAIAEHIGGSVEGFVALMNEKAAWLGLQETHFENPHGLDAPEHYSSAHDLAVLSAYALKNPIFREIVSTVRWTAPLPDAEWNRLWINKNKLLRLYAGADGIKTGYTQASGRSLAASATRSGRTLAAVVLNDGDDWNDAMRLLDYGFTAFQQVELVHPEMPFFLKADGKAAVLYPRRRFVYPLRTEELPRVTSAIETVDRGPAAAGAVLVIRLNGEEIARIPLERVARSEAAGAERDESAAVRLPEPPSGSAPKEAASVASPPTESGADRLPSTKGGPADPTRLFLRRIAAPFYGREGESAWCTGSGAG